MSAGALGGEDVDGNAPAFGKVYGCCSKCRSLRMFPRIAQQHQTKLGCCFWLFDPVTEDVINVSLARPWTSQQNRLRAGGFGQCTHHSRQARIFSKLPGEPLGRDRSDIASAPQHGQRQRHVDSHSLGVIHDGISQWRAHVSNSVEFVGGGVHCFLSVFHQPETPAIRTSGVARLHISVRARQVPDTVGIPTPTLTAPRV